MGQDYQARFIQEGLAIDHTPGTEVAAGDVVIQNNIVGIATRLIEASALGALAIAGIFDVVKAEEAFATVGAHIFWDETGDPYDGEAGTGAATATSVGNTWMGYVLVAAEETDETVQIVLRSTITLTAETFSLADLADIEAVDYTAGDLLVGDGTKYADVPLTGPFNLSAAGLLSMDSATVAAAGSIQGDATALADGFSLVTAADATKGVILPAAAAGGLCIVKNNSASALKVWPNTDDAIDAIAANSEMDVPPYETVRFVAYNATTWYTECHSLASLGDIDSVAYTAGNLLVGDGTKMADVALSGPFNLSAAGLLSMDSATVAAAGSVQGDAGALADGFTLVSAADATKGVVLPAAAAGGFCIVKNNAAAVLKLWPNTSDAIDALGADNAMSIPAYGVRILVAYDATTWYSSVIPTGGIDRGQLAQEDLAVYRISLQTCRSDTGLVLDATGGDTLFAIVNGAFGTGTLTLKGEEAISEAETTTLCFEFALPPEYVDGETIEVDVEVKVDSSGAGNASAETVAVEAYLLANAGTAGSDLASGGAQDMSGGGDGFNTYTSVITPTGLVAGDKLLIFVQTVITEDAGTAVFAVIGNIEVQLDIKG